MSAFASLPLLVQLYLKSVVTGLWLAIVFVGLLLWGDVAGLGRLVMAAPEGPLAVAMLVIFNAIVFSGVQFGIRVMGMAETDDDPAGGRFTKDDSTPPVEAVPVTIASPDRRRSAA